MPLAPADLSSINLLHDFIEAAIRPTGLILDNAALHIPWARAVSAGCAEVTWFFPQAALSAQCLTHLEQLAHGSLPDKGFVLIDRGQIRKVFDVTALQGSQQPHRLIALVKETLNPRREPPHAMEQPPRTVDDPYAILGASPEDNEKTLKSKYKHTLLQYHPDRVAHLGPELKELAAKKTTEINVAFAALRKARGF